MSRYALLDRYFQIVTTTLKANPFDKIGNGVDETFTSARKQKTINCVRNCRLIDT